MPVATLDDIRAAIGSEIGTSDWILVPQERITDFAEATEDRQFIHTDPEMAAQNPDGDPFITLHEWFADTDPNDPASFLAVQEIRLDGDAAKVSFRTSARPEGH